MQLLLDKYRPRALGDLGAERLAPQLAALKAELPHAIIYGPEGCGKLTFTHLWLATVYGPGVHALRSKTWEFKAPSKTVELNIYSTNHHFIINPTMHGSLDRFILQTFIRTVSATSNVSMYHCSARYKVIVVQHADLLTEAAQNALRNTMETYVDSCRIILLTRSLSRISDAIISRCFRVKMEVDDVRMRSLTERICRDEHLSLTDAEMAALVESSCGSYRKLLTDLELLRSGLSTESDLERTIQQVVDQLATGRIEVMHGVRESIYCLMSTVPRPGFILRLLLQTMVCRTDLMEEQKWSMVRYAAETNERLGQGGKGILHFEFFCYAAMCVFANRLQE